MSPPKPPCPYCDLGVEGTPCLCFEIWGYPEDAGEAEATEADAGKPVS
jgi:hypothetical protein